MREEIHLNLSNPVPFPLVNIAALAGLCLLVFIALSVPATVRPNKPKSRDNKEGK